ncbi:hypothetical protein K435DRAFT_669225 [Dendrothele bispora CBS 962.96]|uniref:SWIM-type domain-containing protein n=1 Tax=Dendrothele bispora (strain CBS 962.96) TaxID=1314807 RepID=A0A4S8LWF3_DENBC|nr:hypothetical protein K435DRAFT_669225 [Dendrothele bispora CBS 962.96]
MQDTFSNDSKHLSTQWLLRLMTEQNLTVKTLLQVRMIGSENSGVHFLAILTDGRVICDCCMQLNLGIPCRHYFHIFTRVQGLTFSIGMIRARWLQNSSLDINAIPTVTFNHVAGRSGPLSTYSQLPPLLQTNPVDRRPELPASRPTDTVNARTVFHEANATLRPLIDNFRTTEQLEAFLTQIKGIKYVVFIFSCI